MKKFECPHCGADLNEEGVGYSSDAVLLFEVFVNKGELEYELDETENENGNGFFCRACGKDIPQLTEGY